MAGRRAKGKRVWHQCMVATDYKAGRGKDEGTRNSGEGKGMDNSL